MADGRGGGLASWAWTIAAALALGGCATTASNALTSSGVMMPALQLATGSLHSEMLGVHYIVNFMWIRDGADPPPCPCRPVDRFANGDWSLELDAADGVRGSAVTWLAAHGMEMRAQFDRMVRFLRRAFPDGGARRLRIVLLPAGSRFDGSWTELAVGDDDLPMTFARPLPGPSQAQETSVAHVMPVLAHEYAHSYFWFHRSRYLNNFSDEVGAYTVERCMDAALFGAPYDEVAGEIQPFATTVADLAPRDLYAKYHDRYPDTYLAVFAAVHELAKAKRAAGPDAKQAMRAYCESEPLSGRDFTKD